LNPRKSLGPCVCKKKSAGDVARVPGSSQRTNYRKNGRRGPLNTATWSGVIGAMTTNGFLPSCWFGRAGLGRARGEQRERRLATTAQRSGADDARRRRKERHATRSDRKGAEFQARGQERRTPQRSATVTRSPSSGAAPAASVEAVVWFGSEGDRAQRHALASEGERAGTASARPCGPGRARRSGGEGARAAGRPSGAGSPTRRAAQSVSERGVRAAVEASPAACRAQRRAGALSAGADVTQRSNAERRNDGDGGLDARRVPRGTLAAHAVRPARPLACGRSDVHAGSAQRGRASAGPCARSEIAEEQAGLVTDRRLGGELARDVPLGSRCWFRT